MIQLIAKCSECASEFKVKLETKTVAKGTKKTFFVCPECNHEYITFVKNGEILNEQSRINGMYAEMRQKSTSYERQKELMKDIEKAETSVKRDMERLKRKYS